MSWLDGIEERVVAAYREHGLRALPGHMTPVDGCCCALGALNGGKQVLGGADAAIEALGIPSAEGWELAFGFDEGLLENRPYMMPSEYVTQAKQEAYDAGLRVAKAVIEAGLYSASE